MTEPLPCNWVVVQVGPVLQVPYQDRFRNKQGWWYVYQRSALTGIVPGVTQYREVDPWSATKYQYKTAAVETMNRNAEELRMPWRLVRQLLGQEGTTVCYFPTLARGMAWRPYKTDVIMPSGWVRVEP